MAIWPRSLAHLAKDHRYYELVAETLTDRFDCRCLLLEDEAGLPVAIQPCFLVEEDLVLASSAAVRRIVGWVRRVFPRFLRLRLLMAGCAAGEGAVAGGRAPTVARAATAALLQHAGGEKAALVVWKDLPAACRPVFAPLSRLVRLASMPATRLDLRGLRSFDDYLAQRLSHAARKDLRRKFHKLAGRPPLMLEVVSDVSSMAEEVHALYAQVLARAKLSFERLTPAFIAGLGERMPDRARFFLWRQEGRLVACSICLVHDGVLYDEYLGLDYAVALDLHLYFVTFRDLLSWAIGQGLDTYYSTPLNYGPKRHLGFHLAPLDLYLAVPALATGPLLRRALSLASPARGETVLGEFPNADEL